MSIQFEPLGDLSFHVGETHVRLRAMHMRAVNNDQLGMLNMPAIRVTATGKIRRRTSVTLRKPPLVVHAGLTNIGAMKLPMPRLYARDLQLDVSLELAFVTMPAMQVSASGFVRRRGEALVVIGPKRVLGTDKSNIGIGTMPAMRMLAYDLPEPVRYAILLQTPGYMYAAAGAGVQYMAQVFDSAAATDSLSTHLTIHILDAVNALAAATSSLTGTMLATSTVTAADVANIAFELIASSEVIAADSPELYLDMLLQVSDLVLAAGLAESQLDAFVMVAVVAELHDRADLITMLAVESVGEVLDAAAIERIGLLVHALSEVAATAEAGALLQMIVVGASEVLTSDDAQTQLTGLAQAFEEGIVGASIRVGDDVYAIHAMTLKGAAVSEYTDLTINSQATIGGHMYGASEDGVFLMEGPTDDGEDINAYIRPGLSALGTQLFKSIPAVYLGLTTGGEMLVKVSSTDKGVKHTNVYKTNPVPRGVVTDARVTPTRGKQAVYFDFEVANYEGAGFELETIQVWRLVLSRRK